MRDIEQIIRSIKDLNPEVDVQQLQVSHPGADDDGLWFFDHSNSEFQVQIESSDGMCPFLIETDESDARFTGTSIEETVNTLARLLHLERTKSGS